MHFKPIHLLKFTATGSCIFFLCIKRKFMFPWPWAMSLRSYIFVQSCFKMIKAILIMISLWEKSPMIRTILFFFKHLKIFNWNVVSLQCCLSFRYTAKWFSYTYIYSFSDSFNYRLLQDIEYSSLCDTVGPCCLSILYLVVCIC